MQRLSHVGAVTLTYHVTCIHTDDGKEGGGILGVISLIYASWSRARLTYHMHLSLAYTQTTEEEEEALVKIAPESCA